MTHNPPKPTHPTIAYEQRELYEARLKLEEIQRWAEAREFMESGSDKLFQILGRK